MYRQHVIGQQEHRLSSGTVCTTVAAAGMTD
jgi:hypothetical protein